MCNHRIFSNLPQFYGLPVKPKDAIICQRLALQDITTYDTILMLKKIIKYTLRALLVVLVVLILVPALLYIPAVQDFVRKRAVGYASRALGMDLSVERLRLSFPLRLSVDNTLLVDKADTLLSCGRLSLDVALWPLVRKEVVIRSFGLERVAAPLQGFAGGHGHAPFGGPVVPGCGQGRPLGKYGRHRQPRPVGCRCPAGHNASGSERGSGHYGRTAVDDRHRETLGGQPGFRDADGTCRIGTLRPPGRRHGG